MLGRLAAGQDLSLDEMATAVDAIMQGQWAPGEIALLLTGLRFKGETADEIAGATVSMRRHMTRLATRRTGVLDTCGTGGDGSRTFNISTAAALVAAAAGVPVAKHGNRRITSTSGSADVLMRLGVNVQVDHHTSERCLDELGICFCFAPLYHAAMKHVAPVREKLGVPTIFNLLGPLANPAAAEFQLLGVGKPHLRPLLAEVLAKLGTKRAVVVCGADGLDEVTLAGRTYASEVRDGRVREFEWQPADFGLAPHDLSPLVIDGPDQSAAMIRGVLAGAPGAARDIVVLNAAAALWTAGRSDDPKTCADMAAKAIDSGTARRLLDRLVAMTNE